MWSTDADLIEYYINLPEKFLVRDGDFVYRSFRDIIYLVPNITPPEFFLFIQEINKVFCFYDLDSHPTSYLQVGGEIDFHSAFPSRELDELVVERLSIIAYNLIYSLLVTIRSFNLYLPRLPNIDYRLRPKTRICYRIGDFNLEEGMIILYKVNPWEY
jgi:hypothetical protein